MEPGTNFVLSTGGNVPLSAPPAEGKKKRWVQVLTSKAGIAGMIVMFVIAVILIAHFRKVAGGWWTGTGSKSVRQAEAETPKPPPVDAVGTMTLSEDSWTWPPIRVGRTNGIEYFIKEGDASEYWVRDAVHQVPYRFTNGIVINTDGVRIDWFQWQCKRIRQGPVLLGFTVYH